MTELEVIGSQISYADLRFLYFIPAERRSAGTLATLCLRKKTTMHLDFSLFTLRSSLKYAPSQRCWR
jgi:hypothetical protein